MRTISSPTARRSPRSMLRRRHNASSNLKRVCQLRKIGIISDNAVAQGGRRMIGARKLSLLAGGAVAALAIPLAAYAADAAAPAVSELVVTAEKREENLRDVPQSVTALSGDKLDLLRAVSFQDYVNRVPGMALI